MNASQRSGFTIVEVVVAMVILSTAVLGLAASASRLATTSAAAELRSLAMESVDDQVARVRLDPRYGGLDTLYSGVVQNMFGIPGVTRTTTVEHIQQPAPNALDYKRISVTVTGPLISPAISRQIIVAAP